MLLRITTWFCQLWPKLWISATSRKPRVFTRYRVSLDQNASKTRESGGSVLGLAKLLHKFDSLFSNRLLWGTGGAGSHWPCLWNQKNLWRCSIAPYNLLIEKFRNVLDFLKMLQTGRVSALVFYFMGVYAEKGIKNKNYCKIWLIFHSLDFFVLNLHLH